MHPFLWLVCSMFDRRNEKRANCIVESCEHAGIFKNTKEVQRSMNWERVLLALLISALVTEGACFMEISYTCTDQSRRAHFSEHFLNRNNVTYDGERCTLWMPATGNWTSFYFCLSTLSVYFVFNFQFGKKDNKNNLLLLVIFEEKKKSCAIPSQ